LNRFDTDPVNPDNSDKMREAIETIAAKQFQHNIAKLADAAPKIITSIDRLTRALEARP
jgi:hypothetical protein